MRRRPSLTTILPALLVLVGGCAGPSALDSADAGRTAVYRPGLPNFDMEAVPTLRDGAPGLDLYFGIPLASLVFVQADSASYRAGFEVVVRVLDGKGKAFVAEINARDTVQVARYEETRSARPIYRQERISVATGTYVVEATLRDPQSDKEAVRRQRVQVPDAGAGTALSRIRLEAKAGTPGFEPVVALRMPTGWDSLRAVVEVAGGEGGFRTGLTMRLVRFERDTTVAGPPYWFSVPYGSLRYLGLRLDAADTVQVSRRPVETDEQQVFVEFMLPALPEGVYRIEVEADRGAGQGPLVEYRDLAVHGASFPYVTTLDEMAEALVYIASKREVERIREAPTPAAMRDRFDAFWGELIPSREQAADVLKRYYTRVEEANRLFSTYKAGWKTDRGMVYIVRGAPLYTEDRLDREVWHYSYSEADPAETFLFERVQAGGGSGPFQNHLLVREPHYQRTWTRIVDRWRDGEVY